MNFKIESFNSIFEYKIEFASLIHVLYFCVRPLVSLCFFDMNLLS